MQPQMQSLISLTYSKPSRSNKPAKLRRVSFMTSQGSLRIYLVLQTGHPCPGMSATFLISRCGTALMHLDYFVDLTRSWPRASISAHGIWVECLDAVMFRTETESTTTETGMRIHSPRINTSRRMNPSILELRLAHSHLSKSPHLCKQTSRLHSKSRHGGTIDEIRPVSNSTTFAVRRSLKGHLRPASASPASKSPRLSSAA